jgi:D-threo-aldose 1-dehydrogenase
MTNPERLERLGLGVATQGTLGEPLSDAEADAVFQAAWDAGVRAFDVAPWYGLGLAETRLGRFLRGRDGYTLSTKVGVLVRPDATDGYVRDYSADGAQRSLAESLERLGLERVDTLYIHDPDAVSLGVQAVVDGAGRALIGLRDAGVVQHIGLGMNGWQMPLEYARTGLFDRFLLAGRYTLLEQGSLPFMEYCAEHGVGVVVGGVFNTGLLADPRLGAWYNYAPAPPAVLERALHLKTVCERHGTPLSAAALQFPLAHPATHAVLTAARTPDQLRANLKDFVRPIPLAVWRDLKREGLLSEDVPVSAGDR